MKLNYALKTITLSLFLLLTLQVTAQADFQGEAVYMSKTTVDLDNFGGRELSPERKKMMQDWSNYLDKLQNKTSVYQSEHQLNLF